jgi:glycosyltransferase involved in cell wall biosynthesis
VSVLLVANFLSVNGLNRGYSEELADRLEARGRRVVRTSSEVGRARRLLDMVTTVWRRRHYYDVALIDVFSGPSFVWAEAVAFELRRLGKPYVLTLRGGSLPQFARRWPRRVRHLLQSAAAVTAPSDYLVDGMRAYRADLTVVPNALELGGYVFTTRERVSPRIVWVRAFHAMYNPILAVEVLARIAAKNPGAHLVMIGPDKDGSQRAVEQRAVELGVRDRLEVVGRIPKREIPAHLAAADVFLNTTNVDNAPLSVLEAMAAGLCVVSTAVGGIPFLLEDGDTALLVPPKDLDAMTAAVERILADAALANRLSHRAHAFAASRDWAHVLPLWERLIEGAHA